VWNNIIVVLTKVDYNETQHDDVEEWEEELEQIENDVKDIIKEKFMVEPLGVVALSQALPKKKEKDF